MLRYEAMPTLPADDMAHRSPAFHERRHFGRRATFKRALLRYSDGRQEPCIVVDISEGGARLTVKDAATIREAFDLVMVEDDFAAWCTVAHRTSNSIGVRFARAPRKLSWRKSDRELVDAMTADDEPSVG